MYLFETTMEHMANRWIIMIGPSLKIECSNHGQIHLYEEEAF